jgi:hypothetical protein
MSPASYLTAPPRVAAASIAPVTIGSMTLIWLSLAIGLVLPAIGIVIFVRRGLALWRVLKTSGKSLADGMDDLARRLEAMSARAERLEEVTGRPEPSVARLQVTLARFVVLRAAIGDVQAAVGRVSAVYPRK